MIDAARGTAASGEPLLNAASEVPYATLRGLLEHFVEAPATTSSGFQNFI